MGGFGTVTELYCCERDAGINTPSQRYLDIFYLRKYVCNKQLEKMWRRNLIILPRWLLFPLFVVNRFIGRFVPGGNYHEIGYNASLDRDVYNLIDQFKPHIDFTYEEEAEGKRLLTQFGISQDAKFVCLMVRDSSYTDRYKQFTSADWSYHSYRNGNIANYILAAEELTKRGYYVFRMGAKVEKAIKSSNPKIIDYANSGMRSEFMDVYLGAKCSFCITTAVGFDSIPYIFRKPLASIFVPLGYLWAFNEKNLLITKHHIHKKYKKKLTLSEIFSFNVALAFDTKTYEINNIELKENTPEEIKDLAIEMDERLNGCWNETEEDRSLQKKFWSIFNNNTKKLNLEKSPHGKIKSRFGAKFLRENKNWIR
jgi:putative glycosyltransferase (TIGR04372 family)